MTLDESSLQSAAAYLTTHDPVLAPVIARVDLCTIRPHKNYFQELVQSIIGQQLSLKAAAAIEARFVALWDGVFPTPADILDMDQDVLRTAGLSRGKITYIRDLSTQVQKGLLVLDQFDTLSNEEIMQKLLPVKGIGEWTVHMFLMFCMARADVLPIGDLGIKNGIRSLYNLETQPTAKDIQRIAIENHWHPYETVASWYVWQSLN